jgi:hypothetical protein
MATSVVGQNVTFVQRVCKAGSAADLPDTSNGVAGIAHAGDRPTTLHGVVFDIFVWEREPGRLWRGKRFMMLRQAATPSASG